MNKIIIFLLMGSLISFNLSAFANSEVAINDSIPHYFIYLKSASKPFAMKLGKYSVTKSKIKPSIEYENLEQLYDEFNKTNTRDNERWLIYIHGLWANQKSFEESTGKILTDDVFNKLTDYDRVISLKWSSVLDYHKNVKLTTSKGLELGQIVSDLIAQQKCGVELNFICHSMGNRVFKAMTEPLFKKNTTISQVLMIAADLDNEILIHDLKDLKDHCDKIYCFYNIDDKTLSMANQLQSEKKLGIYGPCQESQKIKNLISINTTGLSDNEGLTPKFTLHRYYYASPSIRKLMVDILNKETVGTLFTKPIKI